MVTSVKPTSSSSTTVRAARLLYPKYGRFFKSFYASLADVCSCAYHSANIQQQEIRAVARKPRDAAGVLGLKFADIIHNRPKVYYF